jgi:hypothetical protein
MRWAKRRYWSLVELWGDLSYGKGRWGHVRRFLCREGLHWPIVWSDFANPGSYDPPEPPEPGWECAWCGKEREPYQTIFWPITGRVFNLVYRLKEHRDHDALDTDNQPENWLGGKG